MKIQHMISLLLLLGCCVVSAQPTNTFTNTNAPSLLSVEQAKSLAFRLAKEKADQLYHYQIWEGNDSTHFEAGHWVWTSQIMDNHGKAFTSRVELAPDGSTNSVDVKFKDHGMLP